MKNNVKEKNLIQNLKDTKLKQNKGITLIALIITIIVLLILAGVSIMMLAGENGILKRAVDASESTKDVNEEEQVKLAVAEALTEGEGKLTKTELENSIGNMFGEAKKENLTGEGPWTYKGERGDYKIGTTGSVESKEPSKSVAEIQDAKALVDKNTEVETKDGVRVVVPAGFTIPIDDDVTGNAKDGIIITDSIDSEGKSNGNEFVWIPIDSKLNVLGTSKAMAKVSTAPGFAGQTGGLTNYEGVFYYFEGEGNNTTSSEGVPVWNSAERIYEKGTAYGQATSGTTNGYREPDTVPDTTYGDGKDEYLGIIRGILTEEASKYTSIGTFKETMQEDYNKMIQSVKTNGGFYVSRYEMGVAGGKAISKSVLPTNSSKTETYRWYGLYGMAKTYKNTNKTTESSVESSMIWGSQYDAMLNYALLNEESKVKVTATGNGYYTGDLSDSAIETGKTETDKIINIYDLEGNLDEWTLEADYTCGRAVRGGDYYDSNSPSNRDGNDAFNHDDDYYGSHFTLYIK